MEEVWCFAPLKRLAGLLTEGDVFPGLGWEGKTPTGVELTIMPVSALRDLVVEPPVDRVAALAVTRSAKLAFVHVPADTELSQANVHVGTRDDVEAVEVPVLEVGTSSRATIVLHYKGSGSYATRYDIRVGDGAEVSLVYVNSRNADAIHGGQISLGVEYDARVRTVQASLGGAVVRLQENARFAGPDDELEQHGLYFVDTGQHIQHRLFVDHNTPETRSNAGYHGALQDEDVNSIWMGDVLTRRATEGIETYKSNKSLVPVDDCRVDSVPNLEIEIGEIEGTGHSSTTGRFDDLQLFYLRSRDVPEAETKRFVVHGFFSDIVRYIDIPEIEGRLLVQVEKELGIAIEVMRAVQ